MRVILTDKLKEITAEQLQRGWYLFICPPNDKLRQDFTVHHKTKHGTYMVYVPKVVAEDSDDDR